MRQQPILPTYFLFDNWSEGYNNLTTSEFLFPDYDSTLRRELIRINLVGICVSCQIKIKFPRRMAPCFHKLSRYRTYPYLAPWAMHLHHLSQMFLQFDTKRGTNNTPWAFQVYCRHWYLRTFGPFRHSCTRLCILSSGDVSPDKQSI